MNYYVVMSGAIMLILAFVGVFINRKMSQSRREGEEERLRKEVAGILGVSEMFILWEKDQMIFRLPDAKFFISLSQDNRKLTFSYCQNFAFDGLKKIDQSELVKLIAGAHLAR